MTRTLDAQPVLRVRAETRIEVEAEQREGEIVLHGTLRDDLGEPLPRRTVTLRVVDAAGVGHLHRVIRTDARGTFEAVAPADLDNYRVSAHFAGDDMHDSITVERVIDVTRANVQLTLTVPTAGRIDLDIETHHFEVSARCPAGVAGLRIELRDELNRPLAEGLTGEDGRVRLSVASRALGGPGPGRLQARFPGDTRRAETRTEMPIVRERGTFLMLAAAHRRVRIGEPIQLHGTLQDSHGPLPGRAVGIFAGYSHRGTVLTNARGAFSWQRQLATENVGRDLVFVARFASDGPGYRRSESVPVTIAVRRANRVRWAWSLLPLSLCGLFLLWLRQRGKPAPPAPVLREPRAGVVRGPPAGRRSHSRRFGGLLLTARDGSPVEGTVQLDGPEPKNLAIGPEGFSFNLPEGTWTATFEAPGYAPLTERFRIPHDGRWERVEVHLETWRDQALALFRRWVLRHAPHVPWRKHTLQELRQTLPATGRTLGERVERAFYGPTPPNAEDVHAIAACVDDATESNPDRGR